MNLNNSVGSTERCQGGFISPRIDDDSTGTDLEMSPELTSVDILDYTLTNHINFEVLAGPELTELSHLLLVYGEYLYAPCEEMVAFHGTSSKFFT